MIPDSVLRVLAEKGKLVVVEIFIGFCMQVIALPPKGKLDPGRIGTKQVFAPIEPAWIGRIFIGGVGLGQFGTVSGASAITKAVGKARIELNLSSQSNG